MSESTAKRSLPELLAPLLVLAATLCVLLTHPVGRWFETDLLSLFAAESTGLSADVMKSLRNSVTDENRRTTVFVVGAKDAKADPTLVRDVAAQTAAAPRPPPRSCAQPTRFATRPPRFLRRNEANGSRSFPATPRGISRRKGATRFSRNSSRVF